MKVEILTINLKKALTILERLTKKTLTLPVLQNVSIQTEKNFLKLTTTDLESSLTWWILAKILKEGNAVVPVNLLRNSVDFIKDEKVLLESEDNNLKILTPNQNIQIQGINPEEYPIIPKIEEEVFNELKNEEVLKGLNQLVNIPTVSQIRPEISGILFSFKKNILKLVGTDSFRLAEKTIEFPKKFQKEGEFILPQNTAKELITILSQQEDEITRVFFDPKQVLFEWFDSNLSHPRIHLLSRLIEGEFPNYQEIIPKKFKTEIIVEKEEFLNQIRQAGIFSGKVSEVKISSFSKQNKIQIFAQTPDLGKIETNLNSQIKGEDLTIVFNYKFLTEGVHNIESSEIRILLSDQEGPCMIKGVGDESYFYVLMPIKSS